MPQKYDCRITLVADTYKAEVIRRRTSQGTMVLNIKCNDFRLIVAIGVVYVKFVGTHAEYDKVDAAIVEME